MRETGKQYGCRHIADDLGKPGRREQYRKAGVQNPGKESMNQRDSRHAVGKQEKQDKRQQQEIVHPGDQAGRKKQDDQQRRAECDAVIDQAKDGKDIQQKRRGRARQKPDVKYFKPVRLNPVLPSPVKSEVQQEQKGNARQAEREHHPEKFRWRYVEICVQIKILRIPERRQGGEYVGRHRFQRDQQKGILSAHPGHFHSQRHNRQKRHVIGDQHGEYTGGNDHDESQFSRRPECTQCERGHRGKQLTPVERMAYKHQRKERGDHIPVDGRQMRPRKKRNGSRQKQGDHEERLSGDHPEACTGGIFCSLDHGSKTSHSCNHSVYRRGLFDFSAVLKMDSDMADPQNDNGNHQPDYFPVNAQQKKTRYGKRRAGCGNTGKTAVKVFERPSASEIPYPPQLIQQHGSERKNQPARPYRPGPDVEVGKDQHRADDAYLSHSFEQQKDPVLIAGSISRRPFPRPYQIRYRQHQQINKSDI